MADKKRIASKLRLAEFTSMWIHIRNMRVAVLETPDKEEEPGDTVELKFLRRNNYFIMSLTAFTEEELDTFMDFIQKAADRARPIVQARDHHAQEQWEHHGDDSYERLYRDVPRIYSRFGKKSEHGQGLLGGSSGSADLADGGERGDGDAGPGGQHVEVPDQPPRGDGSHDDPTEEELLPLVGEVDGDGRVPR